MSRNVFDTCAVRDPAVGISPGASLRSVACRGAPALRRFATALLVAASLCASATPTRAGAVPDGQYVGTADFAPVHLDGRYPFIVGTSTPGTIFVTTSPTGALDARVSLFGATEDAVGQMSSNSKGVRLTLRGKTDEGRISVTASLVGDAFVGTIKLGKKSQPCRIEIAVAGPVRAEFDLALTCSAKGVLKGTGSLLAGSSEIPVTVKGRVRKQVVTLTIQGSRTSLKLTRGKIAAGSIVSASWSTKGFGGSAKGTRRFTLAPQ